MDLLAVSIHGQFFYNIYGKILFLVCQLIIFL